MCTGGVDACLLWVVFKWTLVGSYRVCESNTLGLRLVCKIGGLKGPSLGLLLDYTPETWVGKSLAIIDGTKLVKSAGACKG